MWNPNQIEKLRAETPGCQYKNHLNNAGSSLMPQPVIDAINHYLNQEINHGGYETAAAEAESLRQAYVDMGKLISTKPENIAFTSNATDSFFRALSSIPFKGGDVIVTTDEDYISNQISFLVFEKRFGIKIVRIPNSPNGDLNLEEMERAIKHYKPRLVTATHIPTNSGLIQPVAAVGKMCREHEVIFLVDACQSIGQLVLDVDEIGCDFLSGTGRKFLRGPRGMGFLYVSDRILSGDYEPLMLDMRGAEWSSTDEYTPRADARRFEYWEFPFALVAGMGAAAKYANDIGMENIEKRVLELAHYTRESLSQISGVKVLDKGSKLCGIVTAEISGWERVSFKAALAEKEINTSISDGIYGKTTLERRGVEWATRIAPHYYNTIEEIDQAMERIREIMS